jgi:hypothetical protein
MKTLNNLKTRLTLRDVTELTNILTYRCTLLTRLRIWAVLRHKASKLPSSNILNRLKKSRNGWRYYAKRSYRDELRQLRKLILSIRKETI